MSVSKIIQTINAELGPAIQGVKKGMETYLPESNDQALIFAESAALLQLTTVTLKNIPYALLADGFGVKDVFHFLSSRTNYVEMALICTASAIYSFALAIFYTGMMTITLGHSHNLNYSCKKHWLHIIYSLTAIGIGMVGIVSPLLGMIVTIRLYFRYFQVLKNNYREDLANFEDPLVKQIKNAFLSNRMMIQSSIADISRERYEKEFGPSLKDIESQLRKATKMDDLINLIIRIWSEFPRMRGEQETAKSTKKRSPTLQDHYN